jgi:hypothetical protein
VTTALLAMSSGADAGIAVGAVVGFALIVFEIAALWHVFVKAGDKGWKAIIPIWNILIVLKIAGRKWWWIFLYLIPIVWWIVDIIVLYDLARSFRKGGGFTIGLILLPFIFLPILGFGSAVYDGPYAAGPRAI